MPRLLLYQSFVDKLRPTHIATLSAHFGCFSSFTRRLACFVHKGVNTALKRLDVLFKLIQFFNQIFKVEFDGICFPPAHNDPFYKYMQIGVVLGRERKKRGIPVLGMKNIGQPDRGVKREFFKG